MLLQQHTNTCLSNPNPNPNPASLAPFPVNIAPFCNRQTPASRSVRITSSQTKATSRVFCSSKSLLYLAACLPTMLVHAHQVTSSSLAPPIRSPETTSSSLGVWWSRRRFFLSGNSDLIARFKESLGSTGESQNRTDPPPPLRLPPRRRLSCRLKVCVFVSFRSACLAEPAVPWICLQRGHHLCCSTAPRTNFKGPRTPKNICERKCG